jgi:outer membrane immunogenic protein
MKSLIIAASALTLAAAAAPAMAQSITAPQVYGSIGYTGVPLYGKSLSEITGRIDGRFGRYWGVEGEFGMGVGDVNTTVGGVGAKLNEQPTVAAYGVGYFPLTSRLDLLARIGYGSTDIRTTTADNVSRNTSHSLNYGAGAQYFFTASDGVRAEYTRRDFQESSAPKDADTWSVSYVRKF